MLPARRPAQVAQIFARMAAARRQRAGHARLRRVCYAPCVDRRAAAPSTTKPPAAITLQPGAAPPGKGAIAVVCAGTSDLPVAEEAAVTARLMGNTVELIADVGVAGIHRLLAQKNVAAIGARADCLRRHGGRAAHRRRRAGECAGDRRAHQRGLRRAFGGVAALLGMLNTCSPNVPWSTSTTASARLRSPR